MEEELEQLRIAAESGDKNAMCKYAWELASRSKYGEAFKWFEMSKDLNHSTTYFYLGWCHLHGFGTDKNIEEAINCFLREIELGGIRSALLLYQISHIYDNYVHFDEVVRIFEKHSNNFSTDNADTGSPSLLRFILACCYYWGVETEQNEERAKQLLSSAGYDFDEDKTPLLIKEITMAYPFPKRIPIYHEIFIPLKNLFFDLLNKKSFSNCCPFLNCFNPSKYSKTKELYFIFKKNDEKFLDFYLEAVSEDNANYMRDALEDDNYHDFRNACLKEPNFAGYVLLYNRLKENFQVEEDPLFIDDPEFDDDIYLNSLDLYDEFSEYEKNYYDVIKAYNDLMRNNKKGISTQIRCNNSYLSKLLSACLLIQSNINENDIAAFMTMNEKKKYYEFTKQLNKSEFSHKIYEFKNYCRNNPSIFEYFDFTKEELSSLFGIVEEKTEEFPADKIENFIFKDVSIPDTYKCITFDGCEEAYKKFFEKLKKIDYIDKRTSFESFKVAIGLESKQEGGIFHRVIWKSKYNNKPYWKPLLNMLQLIGIKRDDIKPKTINSLFVHPTGKKIDSNMIKKHKATKEVEFNGKKQSIHKHLCEFLEKSGFPSDKLIHNLD